MPLLFLPTLSEIHISLSAIQEIVNYAEDYISFIQNSFEENIVEFRNLFYITFIEELKNKEFAKLFWGRLLSSAVLVELIKREREVVAIVGKSKEKKSIPSLFKYYIQQYNSFPTLNHDCLPTVNIYSSRLAKWWKNRPIAAFEMPVEVENYLGVQNVLSLENYLELLGEFSKLPASSDIQIKIERVYLEMLMREYSTSELSIIKNWGQNNQLLADNNTFQDVTKLYFFNIAKFTPLQKNALRIKIGDVITNKSELCKLFGVTVVQKEDLKPEMESVIENNELKNRILELVPALTYDTITANGGDFEETKIKLNTKLKQTKFFQCANIHLIYRNSMDELIYETPILSWQDERVFYYSDHWNSIEILYDFIPKLCTYLGLKNREQALQLMLLLPLQRVKQWLKRRGAPNAVIDALVDKNENGEDAQLVIDNSEKVDEYRNQEIGIAGEKYVFEYLVEKYHHQNGVLVVWHNKEGESEKPYDITLEEGNKITYIEVKTTTSSNPKTRMFLSKKEYQFMQQQGKAYQLYRVSTIQNQPQIMILSLDDLVALVLKDEYRIQLT